MNVSGHSARSAFSVFRLVRPRLMVWWGAVEGKEWWSFMRCDALKPRGIPMPSFHHEESIFDPQAQVGIETSLHRGQSRASLCQFISKSECLVGLLNKRVLPNVGAVREEVEKLVGRIVWLRNLGAHNPPRPADIVQGKWSKCFHIRRLTLP